MDTQVDIARIAEQERVLVFDRFDEEAAWSLGALLRERSVARKTPVVIDVQAFGRQMFYAALPGSTPDNEHWVRRKRNVVLRFHRSSYAVGLELALKGTSLENPFGLGALDYAAHGGAFPLRVKECGVVGCVTVSGLPQRDDHREVVSALCSLLSVDESRLALD